MTNETGFSALIVDDESLSREGIRLRLSSDPDISEMYECDNGEAAIKQIESLRPNLVFLDIQMSDITGLDVIRAVGPERMPTVIFVTAYDKYALEAFELQALDYLLKPYTPQRFSTVLERAKKHLRDKTSGQITSQLAGLLEGARGPKYLQRLMIRSGGRISFVSTQAVHWFQSAGNYVRVHTGKESHLLHSTLHEVEARLDPKVFIRIHRSHIVNASNIKEFHSMFGREYLVVLSDGTRLTSGRAYRKNIEEFIRDGKA